MRDAKREKSQHGYLPTVVDRTLALTRRCAHPMFMGCPRVAQRDAAPSPGSLLRLTLRPRYRDVNVWAFIAQHVPEMPGRVLHSRSHPAVAGIAPPQADAVGPSLQLRESVLRYGTGGRHGLRITDPAEHGIHAAAGLELWRGRIVRQAAIGVADRCGGKPVKAGGVEAEDVPLCPFRQRRIAPPACDIVGG